jgi:hypothetical protein
MAVQTVQDMALSQIPDFYSWISWCRKKVAPIRVESNWGDCLVGSIIMLDQSLTSDVPNLHRIVRGAWRNTSSIRVKLYRVNRCVVVSKTTN